MALANQLTETPLFLIHGKNATGGDLSAKRFVKGHLESILLPAADTDAVLGILRELTKDKAFGSVMTLGVGIVTCAGNITAGGRVTTDNAGKAVAWASAKSLCGIALDDGSNGTDIRVLLT